MSRAAGAPPSRRFSAHQRSLQALARVMSAPLASADVAADVVDHAKALVDDVQAP